MSNKLETGIQYMQEGNWEEAAKNFTEAIEENPKDALGYINFANLLDVLGDSERAILFYKRALELDDNPAAAYYGLGNVYYGQEQFAEAKAVFEQAMQAGLQSADVTFMLGITHVQLEMIVLHCRFTKSNRIR